MLLRVLQGLLCAPLLLYDSSPELSDTKVYVPYMRALLGTASHFCEVVVLAVYGDSVATLISWMAPHHREPSSDGPSSLTLVMACSEQRVTSIIRSPSPFPTWHRTKGLSYSHGCPKAVLAPHLRVVPVNDTGVTRN